MKKFILNALLCSSFPLLCMHDLSRGHQEFAVLKKTLIAAGLLPSNQSGCIEQILEEYLTFCNGVTEIFGAPLAGISALTFTMASRTLHATCIFRPYMGQSGQLAIFFEKTKKYIRLLPPMANGQTNFTWTLGLQGSIKNKKHESEGTCLVTKGYNYGDPTRNTPTHYLQEWDEWFNDEEKKTISELKPEFPRLKQTVLKFVSENHSTTAARKFKIYHDDSITEEPFKQYYLMDEQGN